MKRIFLSAILALSLMSFTIQDLTLCTGKHIRNGTTVKLMVSRSGVQSIVHYDASGHQYGDVVYPTSNLTTAQFRVYCEQHDYIAGC